ncbi:hypothetical protein AKJ09_01974 [Labilithrix luteola]|uniref:Uncharacterized protein n=1 Tax=Labilithrix luteola TaxID=1391654 RepID=A0A0K1PP46_9BACT|nr:hypothetical protein AKJ09_01974 [Labilithrix luteola]
MGSRRDHVLPPTSTMSGSKAIDHWIFDGQLTRESGRNGSPT